jgi:Fe-S-cluster-containing dehydrogenase component
MAVLVNFKICDNAKECGGIAVCPTGALSYDDEKESIIIDNDKCISCGRCESECPIGAIMVARTDEEYDKLKEEIDNDTRTTKDLFVDRYGATPLSEFFMIEYDDIENKVNNDGITLIELYNDDSIQCLLKSIAIKDLTKDLPKDTLFYKAEANDDVLNKYNVNELPSLLVFKKGKFLGNIDGYYEVDNKKELLHNMNEILNK